MPRSKREECLRNITLQGAATCCILRLPDYLLAAHFIFDEPARNIVVTEVGMAATIRSYLC